MRNEPNIRIEKYRDNSLPEMPQSPRGASYGMFAVKGMRVISSGVSEETGWEHVSVSRPDRCPSWEDMCIIKKLFWRDDETVVQFHPKETSYINNHPYCLHLWKKTGEEFELPPEICV